MNARTLNILSNAFLLVITACIMLFLLAVMSGLLQCKFGPFPDMATAGYTLIGSLIVGGIACKAFATVERKLFALTHP